MPIRTHQFAADTRPSRRYVPPCLLAAASLMISLLAACGDAAQADEAQVAAEGGMPAASAMPERRDASQDTVTYRVGDVYEVAAFKAKYLGMAKLPLGTGRVFTDGSCVTLLFEVTYGATSGSSGRFRPSAKGYLTDGRIAENDDTGVGCETKGIRALGYTSAPRHSFKDGETTKLFIGAIHLPPADADKLAYVTLYGSDRTRVAVEIVATP